MKNGQQSIEPQFIHNPQIPPNPAQLNLLALNFPSIINNLRMVSFPVLNFLLQILPPNLHLSFHDPNQETFFP